MSIKYSIQKRLPGSLARAGTLVTPHGVIHTPAFVTVGTKASVKALTPAQVKSLGAEVVLANTYHLYLEPGSERVREFGGLHKFMNWQGPLMTDSGGFQVFSLGAAYGKEISKVVAKSDPSELISERSLDSEVPRLAEVGQDGVSFRSHLDGSLHYITPEKSIEIQHDLGADIIFAFDECTSPQEDFRYQEEALERTHRWALRSLKRHQELEAQKNSPQEVLGSLSLTRLPSKNSPAPESEANLDEENLGMLSGGNIRGFSEAGFAKPFPQALFGIVQGGREEILRKRSAEFFSKLDFDGYGIGGSFAKEDMSTAVKWVNEILPEDKPRHLLGIGEPEDLFMGVEQGVDLFDCVLPTRNGRTGKLYTSSGKINITNAQYRDSNEPIDSECGCEVCQSYTLGYVHHLYRSKEMLAATLGSMHNLYFLVNLIKKMRQAIIDDTFNTFKEEFLAKYL
jgi:queuine tRNA-ribosyltransferase